MQDTASLAVTPQDADDDPANGHQVADRRATEIAVTVTSADGLRTRAYRVQVEPSQIAPKLRVLG